MNYARRQHHRRLSKAVSVAVASASAGLMALALASVGAMSFAGVLVIAAVALGLYARRWFRLAGRSGGRRTVRGRSPSGVRAPAGGGLAIAALAAVARAGRHRLASDRTQWSRGRHRDEDEDVQRQSSQPRTRAGGLAVSSSASVMPHRRGGDALFPEGPRGGVR
jgi:hypothetical protein